MIKRQVLESAIYNTIRKSSCEIPADVRAAIERAAREETQGTSKKAFEDTLQSLNCSRAAGIPACGDTGWPLFFCKVGNEAQIEGGVLGLEEIGREAVKKATEKGLLRKTMKHPLTGDDPGTNVGANVPWFTYRFVSGNSVEITFVPKGGGGELFGGSRYAVIGFGDGIQGIEKFVIDAYISGARAGAICPPSIVGIGVGGTFEISAKLAKEAAVLRPIGSRHPDPEIAGIEKDLFEALSELKIGAMGSGGDVSVFDVHLEYAYTHIAGITVSMNTGCLVTRRATTRIDGDGRIEELEEPGWFDRR